MNLVVNTDGACAGNPGPMGVGAVIYDEDEPEGGRILELCEYHGNGTNNLAEYRAIVRALEMSVDLKATRVKINCDNLIVVNQIKRKWKCRIPHLLAELAKVHDLMGQFTDGVEFTHVYDTYNEAADRLARLGVKRGHK